MTLLPFLVAIWLFAVGLYGIATTRNLIHLLACLSIVQASSYLVLLSVGYRTGGSAPIFLDFPKGVPEVDPVVQALTLTDIVVGAAFYALLLALALKARKFSARLDPDDLRKLRG